MSFKNYLAFILLILIHSQGCEDPCRGVDCQQGTCELGDCICQTGYEGEQCEKEERTKFLDSYEFTDQCVGGIETYNIEVTPHNGDITKVQIYNLYRLEQTVVASVNRIYLTIEEQPFSTGTISGEGSITDNDKLKISYTVNFNGNTDSCTGVGERL